MERQCTCAIMKSVDLTTAFGSAEGILEVGNEQQQTLLRDNLKLYGWTPLHIDVSDNVWPTDHSISKCFQSHTSWKTKLLQLLRNKTLIRTQGESGSGSNQQVEPKLSMEVHRRVNEDTSKQPFLQTLVETLHTVAKACRQWLNLPENVLLVETNEATSNDTIDLLRVFYYDTVVPSSHEMVMGSSPHTDWGSFTVVWQDDVGGLQTYCVKCDQWNDVPANTTHNQQNSSLNLVLHMGDVTSLALALASNGGSLVQYPSPRHRVLSPTVARRLSVVYFAYPPASYCLKDIVDKCIGWDNTPKAVPYGDYYLLRNQHSCETPSNSSSSKDVLAMIYDEPLANVFAEKWRQVQRD